MTDRMDRIQSDKAPVLILVVPCYNEEEIISRTAAVMADKLGRMTASGTVSPDSRILFVDDGSTDKTFGILGGLCDENTVFSVVKLVGNRGHQNAILAGMMTAKDHSDIVVTIDADLQQDIEALDDFIAKYKEGFEIVYGVRNDRDTDNWFKRTSASLYYSLMRVLGSKVIPNHADYRLVSSRVLNALADYSEVNLFLRGLIPTMGFPSAVVYFDVKKREAGTSKYTMKKMLTLAADGITSFSTRPLHLIGITGFGIVILGVIMAVIVFVDWLRGRNVPGYTTLMMIMLAATGVILLSLGVIGEYIAKIYMETKHRPHYIIDSVIWNKNDE